MTKLGFDTQTSLRRPHAANDHDSNVSSAIESAGRPCLVTLESGIQALVKITSFTYVDGIPVAIGGGFAEDVDPAEEWLERGPDGVCFKGIMVAEQPRPFNVKTHHLGLQICPEG